MGAVEEILEKRVANRARLEQEAPNLYAGFNDLMKAYYKPSALERSIRSYARSRRRWRRAASPAWPTTPPMP